MDIRKVITDFQNKHKLTDAQVKDILIDFIEGADRAEISDKSLWAYFVSYLEDRQAVLTGGIRTEGTISRALRHHAEAQANG